MAKQSVTRPASDRSSKTLPYKPVWEICCNIGGLARGISSSCTLIISDDPNVDPVVQALLIRNAADTIGLMADHCIDGDMQGDAANWLGLPDMKEQEGKS